MRRRSFFFLFAATLPDWGRALVKPGVLEDFSRQYGSQAVRRLNAWRDLMDEISGLPLPSRLTRTNAFFNQLAFAETASNSEVVIIGRRRWSFLDVAGAIVRNLRSPNT